MNPADYLQRDKHCCNDIEEDPRSIINGIFNNICKRRFSDAETHLERIFKYAVLYIKQGANPDNPNQKLTPRKKECLLRVLCMIFEHVKKEPSLL